MKNFYRPFWIWIFIRILIPLFIKSNDHDRKDTDYDLNQRSTPQKRTGKANKLHFRCAFANFSAEPTKQTPLYWLIISAIEMFHVHTRREYSAIHADQAAKPSFNENAMGGFSRIPR